MKLSKLDLRSDNLSSSTSQSTLFVDLPAEKEEEREEEEGEESTFQRCRLLGASPFVSIPVPRDLSDRLSEAERRSEERKEESEEERKRREKERKEWKKRKQTPFGRREWSLAAAGVKDAKKATQR